MIAIMGLQSFFTLLIPTIMPIIYLFSSQENARKRSSFQSKFAKQLQYCMILIRTASKQCTYHMTFLISRGSSSYNRKSSKASSTATSAVVGPPPAAHGPMANPPPAHSNSYSTSSTVRNGSYHNSSTSGGNGIVKKEPSQLSPVKKRIKETKDHTHYELYRQQQPEHSPGKNLYRYFIYFWIFLSYFLKWENF